MIWRMDIFFFSSKRLLELIKEILFFFFFSLENINLITFWFSWVKDILYNYKLNNRTAGSDFNIYVNIIASGNWNKQLTTYKLNVKNNVGGSLKFGSISYSIFFSRVMERRIFPLTQSLNVQFWSYINIEAST